MQRLVHVLGPESPAMWPLLLPMLQHSLDAANNREPELLEDGLQLWLVALRNAPSADAQAQQVGPEMHLLCRDGVEGCTCAVCSTRMASCWSPQWPCP